MVFGCDDWQRDTTFSENLILSGGLVHKGHNHVINNLFINGNIRFSLYPGQQPNPGSKVHHNVFYFTRAGIVPYTGRQSETIRTPESCELRNNTYFSEVDRPALQQFLAESRARGMDQGSQVADPAFAHKIDLRAEAHPGGLRLAPDSPAIQIGFKPIDTGRIGLRPDYPACLLADVFPLETRSVRVGNGPLCHRAVNPAMGIPRRSSSPGRIDRWRVSYESEEEEAPSVTLELDNALSDRRTGDRGRFQRPPECHAIAYRVELPRR